MRRVTSSVAGPAGRRRVALACAAAATLALVAGCSDVAPSATPSTTPSSTPSTTPTSSPAGAPFEVTAYFVGGPANQPRIYPEKLTVTTTDDGPTAALKAAFGDPLDPDYHSPWKDFGVTVNSLRKVDHVYVVDLGGIATLRDLPDGMTQATASAALDQILWTVKDAFTARRIQTVRILSDGRRIPQVLGIPTAGTLTFGNPLDVLGLVSITSIQEGDTLTGPVHVAGLGAAFEAQLVWRVFDSSGDLVEKGTTLAEECCRMAPFSFDVELDPGTYTIEVEDTDPSGGEGLGPWQDTKTFTVS